MPTKLIDVFLRDEYLRSYSVVLGFVNAPIFDQDYVDRARLQMQADGWSADEVQQARFVVRFVTFGCKANQYDTQVLREALVRRGWSERSRTPSSSSSTPAR